jgi:hypothetical protein
MSVVDGIVILGGFVDGGGRRKCLDSSLSATQQEGERYPNRAVAGLGWRLVCVCVW